MKLVVRVFGFVQWLAAVAIAALIIVVQIQTLEQVQEGGVAEALVANFGGIDAVGGPAIAEMIGVIVGSVSLAFESMSVTTPALLLSILLMLSALYCQRAAGPGGRRRSGAAGSSVGEPDAHPGKQRDDQGERDVRE